MTYPSQRLSSTETAWQQEIMAATLQDQCYIRRKVDTILDALGNPDDPYWARNGDALYCAVARYSEPREVLVDSQTVMAEAEIRLPSGTHIRADDRLEVTHMATDELDVSLFYEVIGPPLQLRTAVFVKVRAIPGDEGHERTNLPA